MEEKKNKESRAGKQQAKTQDPGGQARQTQTQASKKTQTEHQTRKPEARRQAKETTTRKP